jgi:hypothetical protein
MILATFSARRIAIIALRNISLVCLQYMTRITLTLSDLTCFFVNPVEKQSSVPQNAREHTFLLHHDKKIAVDTSWQLALCFHVYRAHGFVQVLLK